MAQHHTQALGQVLGFQLSIQFPANGLEKQQEGPTFWVSASNSDTWKSPLAPGFVSIQLWLLQPFGK